MNISEDKLNEMVTAVRVLTDQVVSPISSPATSDDEIKKALQRSANKLYYDLVDSNENYFIKELDFNVENGQRITLPADFYKIVGLFKNVSNSKIELEKVDISQLSSESGGGYYEYLPDRGSNRIRYVIVSNFENDQIIVLPERRSEGQYTLLYAPEAPNILGLRIPRGYEDFFIYDTAIDIAGSDYSETIEWRRKAEANQKMLMAWYANRSSAYPNKVKRVQRDELTIEDQDFLGEIISDVFL